MSDDEEKEDKDQDNGELPSTETEREIIWQPRTAKRKSIRAEPYDKKVLYAHDDMRAEATIRIKHNHSKKSLKRKTKKTPTRGKKKVGRPRVKSHHNKKS